MATIKYDGDLMWKAMKPGLNQMITISIKDKLEAKVNALVKEFYEELNKELPKEIESTMRRIIDVDGRENVNITVDLRGGRKDG